MIPEPDCSDRRPGCRDDRRSCDFPDLRYDEYLERQNQREPAPPDRYERGHGCDHHHHHGCEPARYERPACRPVRGCKPGEDAYRMPKIGDVSKADFDRAVERAVQVYLVRALTNIGSRIDLFM